MSEMGVIPVMPRRMRTKVARGEGELRLRCRNREWAGGCFMMLWLTMWTVGCAALAREVIVKREAFLLLFGVPFWASWFFVFFMLLKAFFQVEEVVLNSEGLRFSRRVIVVIKSRVVPMEELGRVTRYSTVVDSESGRMAEGLELETSGQAVRMLQGLGGEELQWLAYQMNEQIGALTGRVGGAKEIAAAPMATGELPGGDTGAAAGTAAGEDPDDASLLILTAGPAAVPTDSQWREMEGAGDLAYAWRGRFRLGQVGGLLFLNLFCNGIVSVFVMALFGWMPGNQGGMPQGIGWWGLFVFLIPFEVIGLLMFLGLLHALGEPIHSVRWTFSASGVERRNTWLGAGVVRKWTVTRLGRLELKRERGGAKGSGKFRFGEPRAETTYSVMLVTEEGRELCAIKGLTQGEARWMAQGVLRHCRGWFG